MSIYQGHILIGMDESALRAGALEVKEEIINQLEINGIKESYNVLETGPLGFFGKGVCMIVYPDGIRYQDIKVSDVENIVKEHLLKGRPVRQLVLDTSVLKDYDFNYKNRIVLEHSGIIDPENIEEYIGAGGYEALEKAITSMSPEEVIEEVKKSGLRGRGGAGFPAGLKWSFTAPIKAETKYIVVNADEGEPGTFKDRLIMEGDPHKLLEGIMLAAYAVGANKSYIYVRGEYKLCISRLRKAIEQAYEYGLLGKNIFGKPFTLDIDIKVGAGAYVCGEETALIESMEGNRGNPRLKPPFPGVKGAWQNPTVVNNVETLSNIPYIVKNGGEAFSAIGVEGSTGTKVYTILGDVAYPGLCEVEMGMSMRAIINNYGGGMTAGKKFKAALVGGAAGVFLPDSLLDVKMDYKSLNEYSAVLGSGAILVISEETSMVEMLHSIIRFFRHESCGKCSPCRLGTQELYLTINKIRSGYGTKEDIDKMILLSETMKNTSFCALGQSLIMPIKSAIDNYYSEFEQLLKK